jgi:hypothetical protein
MKPKRQKPVRCLIIYFAFESSAFRSPSGPRSVTLREPRECTPPWGVLPPCECERRRRSTNAPTGSVSPSVRARSRDPPPSARWGPYPGDLGGEYAAPVPVSRRPSAPQTAASVTPARTRTSGCLTTASASRALSWDGRQRAVDTPRCATILGKGALENLCCPWRGGAGRGACGGKN